MDSVGGGARGRHKFAKVSDLLHLLHTDTIESTFQNVCPPGGPRHTFSKVKHNKKQFLESQCPIVYPPREITLYLLLRIFSSALGNTSLHNIPVFVPNIHVFATQHSCVYYTTFTMTYIAHIGRTLHSCVYYTTFMCSLHNIHVFTTQHSCSYYYAVPYDA